MMSPRLVPVLLLAGLLAGCGSSGKAKPGPTPTGVAEGRGTPVPGSRAPDACGLLTPAEVFHATGVKGVKASGARTGPTTTRCVYRLGRDTLNLSVDTAPQAERRFFASEDETQQVANQGGGDHTVVMHGIAKAAYWLAGAQRMTILDGDRILILDVRLSGPGLLRLARRLGHAAVS
ncbi:MAG: hypothetical protein QOF76_1909 [Solirubrobacteraceae bacterium]|nr:hypothetical protein [Solirubrobacteraceae bacterium]